MASKPRGLDGMIDEVSYRTAVLRALPDTTEDELDRQLELEADRLGIHVRPLSVDRPNSLVSCTSVASDLQKPSSAFSASTRATSCSSGEWRRPDHSPTTQLPPCSRSQSMTPISSVTEKRASDFRGGFRKLSIFRRKFSGLRSPTFEPAGIDREVAEPSISSHRNDTPIQNLLESPVCCSSGKGLRSLSIPSTTKSVAGYSDSDDTQAMQQRLPSVALLEMQTLQGDERDRFLEYQRKCLADHQLEYEESKRRKIDAQSIILKDKQTGHERSLCELESRHLEAEIQLCAELDYERRKCILRLRHMEAYCQYTPQPLSSPPLTPSSTTSSHRRSIDPTAEQNLHPNPNPTPPSSLHPDAQDAQTDQDDQPSLPTPPPNFSPSRIVTEKDLNKLAQKCRERDSMQARHRAKIDVLRGRQEQQYSAQAARQRQELAELERQHCAELRLDDDQARRAEETLRQAFAQKKRRLQRRWRLELAIEAHKIEEAKTRDDAGEEEAALVEHEQIDEDQKPASSSPSSPSRSMSPHPSSPAITKPWPLPT